VGHSLPLELPALSGTSDAVNGEATPPGLRVVRRSLLLVALPMVFVTFGLPLRAQDLGAGGFEIGVLFSLFTVALLILRPAVGWGVDRFGRRRFFLASLACYALTNALYALAEGLWPLYVARFVHGVALAGMLISTDTITADLTDPETRTAAMGSNMASQGRGGMIGAFFAFTLVGVIPLHAWQLSFATFALVAVVACGYAAVRLPETYLPKPDNGAVREFTMPPLLNRLTVVVVIAALGTSFVQPLYLVYLQSRFDLEMRVLAGAFLPLGLVYAILPGYLGRLAQRLGRARSMTLGWVGTGVLYFSIPHLPTLILIIALFTLSAIGSIIADVSRNALVGDTAGTEGTGRAFGRIEFASGLGAAIGPLAGGLVYDLLGKELVFMVTGGFVLCAAALVPLYLRIPRDDCKSIQ
tara:strand:- start:554 stop:1789 length:1236 start_codon:yes stop_codon:yes gene_type:complete